MASSIRKPTRMKVAEHRQRLRRQGLRPIQIWVPDQRAANFQAEAHRQSRMVALSEQSGEDQYFIDAISDQGAEE